MTWSRRCFLGRSSSAAAVAAVWGRALEPREDAVPVDAPTVEEAPIHCECRTVASLEVPPMRKLFLAEVVATTAREGAVDPSGRLLVPSVPIFGMTAGSGEHYTVGERVGNLGMTVGRTDIKY